MQIIIIVVDGVIIIFAVVLAVAVVVLITKHCKMNYFILKPILFPFVAGYIYKYYILTYFVLF
jgi:hypothetical protein